MNGMIELKLNGNKVTVIGGPYRDKPPELKGVKLAEEIDAAYDLKLDIPDFSVPNRVEAYKTTLEALDLLNREGVIYVGCMGGIGRTGLFMALLVKATGYYNLEQQCVGLRGFWNRVCCLVGWNNGIQYCGDMITYPVEFVRAHYLSHAVETQEQYQFVRDFEFNEFDADRIWD